MEHAPPEFRAKYEQLKQLIDPVNNKPIADILGDSHGGFTVNPSGGHTFYFWGGAIYSFDHTGRFPLVCVHGPIYELHRQLGGVNGGFGRPITDVVDLTDGTKCCIMEGGHIHSLGNKAEPFPADQCIALYRPVAPMNPFGIRPGGMPASFHQRWMELSITRHPSGNTIVQILGAPQWGLHENPYGGQRFHFQGGELVSLNNDSAPYVVYGEIWAIWKWMGNVNSGWGRPLVDEQGLEDGGRCSVMEGGHIHWNGNVARGVSAELCTARYKPTARAITFNKMPPHFQRKWSLLAVETHPAEQKSVVQILGGTSHGLQDNPKKPGQHYMFSGGLLVSLDNNPEPTPMQPVQPSMSRGQSYPPPQGPSPTFPAWHQPTTTSTPLELIPPFALYGVIYEFQKKEGGLAGKYGRPLCDEQDLGDGGRCTIFEGGHIHMYNGVAGGAPAETCTAPYQPRPPAPPPEGRSPHPNYHSQSGSGSWPNYQSQPSHHHQPNYPATPQPQVHGQSQTDQQQHDTGKSSGPGGCWYCLTGINLDEGPEECGPRLVFCITGLKPGQHSGYCCHGCCHVTM